MALVTPITFPQQPLHLNCLKLLFCEVIHEESRFPVRFSLLSHNSISVSVSVENRCFSTSALEVTHLIHVVEQSCLWIWLREMELIGLIAHILSHCVRKHEL